MSIFKPEKARVLVFNNIEGFELTSRPQPALNRDWDCNGLHAGSYKNNHQQDEQKAYVMKNRDMFLIEDSQNENNSPHWFDSLEDTVMNILTSVGFIIALVLIAVNVEAASYDANYIRDDYVGFSDVHQGSLLYKTDTPGRYSLSPSLKTEVNIKVSGMVVRTKLTQQFKNESSQWLEGVYVFPLPESAAVDHMKLRIGERTIEGQIKERQEAKRIYNQAKRQGKKAALIEQERPNLFTNSVANIGPGETVLVEIEYQQVVKFDNGQFKLRFPSTITPRYIPNAAKTISTTENIENDSGWSFKRASVSDASRITPPQNNNHSKQQNPISIYVELNAGFAIKEINSSYHEIKSVMHMQGQYTVSLINNNIPSDRDFELVWQPELGTIPQAALFTEVTAQQEYHLVMIMPPSSDNQNQVLARDVTYIIDTSGSMHGASMRQAKSALLLAISRLRTFDKFNIIEFDSITNSLFSQSRLATSKNTSVAINFVRRLTADGGTEMLSALKAALTSGGDSEYIRQIIFLTDGSVGNEDELFGYIKNNLGTNRLFTVAIGSSPNSHFMTKAAKFGRGTYTYIGKISEVKQKMSALFSKLEKPVMHNLTVHWPKGMDVEVWPKRLPDLYAGEPLIFTAKVNKNSAVNSNQQLLITGNQNQQNWQTEFTLSSTKHDTGIAILWAREKIASIMDGILEYRNNSSSQIVKDLKQKIITLALAHHLVSKYTSLVAVDTTPTRPELDKLMKSRITNSMPRSKSRQELIPGQYAQTATSGELHLLMGVQLLLLSLLFLLRKKWVFKKLRSLYPYFNLNKAS